MQLPDENEVPEESQLPEKMKFPEIFARVGAGEEGEWEDHVDGGITDEETIKATNAIFDSWEKEEREALSLSEQDNSSKTNNLDDSDDEALDLSSL